MYACVRSCLWLFQSPWTVACQVLLSMRFPRQEYWSGLPFPSPVDLPNPDRTYLHWQVDSLPPSHQATGTPGLKLQLCFSGAPWLSQVTWPHLKQGDNSKDPVLQEFRECSVICMGLGQRVLITIQNPLVPALPPLLGAVLSGVNIFFLDESWLCRAPEASAWISILAALYGVAQWW